MTPPAVAATTTTTMLWDDTIDWGDEDSSTIQICKDDFSHEAHTHTGKLPSKKGLSKSVTNATRPVTPPRNQRRLGKKRSSWFDWFESDDEGTHSTISPTTKEKETTKPSRKTNESNEKSKSKNESATTAFLPQSILSLVPLEDEGMSTKQYIKTSRRRTLENMGNDEAALEALRERAKRPTKNQSKFVKKSSKGLDGMNSSQEKLHVPFPSRPRRRSAW
jgi:hypothetical protein